MEERAISCARMTRTNREVYQAYHRHRTRTSALRVSAGVPGIPLKPTLCKQASLVKKYGWAKGLGGLRRTSSLQSKEREASSWWTYADGWRMSDILPRPKGCSAQLGASWKTLHGSWLSGTILGLEDFGSRGCPSRRTTLESSQSTSSAGKTSTGPRKALRTAAASHSR